MLELTTKKWNTPWVRQIRTTPNFDWLKILYLNFDWLHDGYNFATVHARPGVILIGLENST